MKLRRVIGLLLAGVLFCIFRGIFSKLQQIIVMHTFKKLARIVFTFIAVSGYVRGADSQTTITRWPFDKRAAVSITFDDGIRTQFTQALPVLNRLKFPGTFFIVTGAMQGSRYPAKFAGRPVGDIMTETKTIPTGLTNFFERASAMRFLGFRGTAPLFYRAGSLFENREWQQAYRLTDSVYAMAVAGELSPGIDTTYEAGLSAQNSWQEFQHYAAQGHEFAIHSLSHPFMAILDSSNIYYELEKCKEEIISHLGVVHTFSAEVPFGSEDERVMGYVLRSGLFPALRNKLADPFVAEINRGYATQPGALQAEYVQWQRGPTGKTPVRMMQSWVDTLLRHHNIWLVLVFHGIDKLGWEPIPHEELAAYFRYIKDREQHLWVATFRDVTKYIRERMAAKVDEKRTSHSVFVSLHTLLDSLVYDVPVTLKTYIPRSWVRVRCRQGQATLTLTARKDQGGTYVLYQSSPCGQNIQLSKQRQ